MIFFIVLDLRLTNGWGSAEPFFYAPGPRARNRRNPSIPAAPYMTLLHFCLYLQHESQIYPMARSSMGASRLVQSEALSPDSAGSRQLGRECPGQRSAPVARQEEQLQKLKTGEFNLRGSFFSKNEPISEIICLSLAIVF